MKPSETNNNIIYGYSVLFVADPVGDYKLPFEVEVGPHPSLGDMQDVVVSNKLRPKLERHWYSNPVSYRCSNMSFAKTYKNFIKSFSLYNTHHKLRLPCSM